MLYTDAVERILQSDIFFFITSVAVVAIAIALLVVLFQVFRILRSVRRISKHVEEEVGEARGTLSRAREELSGIPGLSFLSRKRTPKRGSKKQSQ